MATSSSIGCSPTADDAFGPIVQNCRQGFDFTLTFELCLFTILPALLLLLAAPLRLRHLAKLPRAVTGTALRLAKQAAIGVLAVLQLALVALWATHREAGRLRTVSIVASCASFAAAVMFGGLSSIEHAKSLKPSSILNIYMLVSLVLDGAILRTVWLSRLSVTISAVFSTSFALKAVIVILEAWGKTPYLAGGRGSYSPEETSGIYSRGLFWWLTPLLLTGFRRLLKPLDLFVLEGSMSTAVLDERFWHNWNKASSFSATVQPGASPRPKRHRLIRTCVSTLKWQLLAVILPRIFLLGFTICQPLILNRFLDFLQNTPEDVNYGYGLIGAYGFVYLGISISSSIYWHKAFRSLAMLRGILVTAVYSKTTELRVAPGDNSAAVTLMSTDVDVIIRAWREVHEFWANTIQIALATWLLSTHLGYAASGPIVVSVVALIATVFFAPAAQKYQVIWVEKEFRGASTLADLRIDEMKAATPFRVIGAITSAVAQVPLLLAPVVAFAMYTTIATKTSQTLDATKLFAALSLIILLANPLFWMFEVVLDTSAALACFQRIETYLTEPPQVEYRSFPSDLQPGTQSTGSYGYSQDIQLQTLENRGEHALKRNPSTRPALSVQEASLSWKGEADSILSGLNFDIQKGQLVMLVGPVASGKSTLLKGLLGELPHVKGTVALSSTRVSWCEQSPWLINETVRKNIICLSEFDLHLYRQVLKACDLEKDLAQLPEEDLTIIGSKGIVLSGGQKQRVALARAIYSRPEIALFDDIFSGLDNHTARTVFQRVFSADEGMLRAWGTSIVLATQSVSFLSRADMIFTLGDGKIAEMGSFEKCRNAGGYVGNLVASGPRSRDEDKAQQEKTANETTSQVIPERKAKAVEEQVDKRRQLGDWSVYGYYFGSVGTVLVAIMIFLQVTWAFFSTFPTVWLKFWTDANVEAPGRHDAYYLGIYAALQVGGVFSFAVLIWFVLVPVAAKSGINLYQRLLKAVVHAPLSLFTSTDIGSITTRFSQDIGLIDRSLPLALVISLASFFTCIGKAFLIASVSWYIAISFPVLILVFYYIQRAYLRTSRQLRLLDLEEKAPIYTHFLETLSGLPTLRAHALTHASIARSHALIDRSQRPFYILLLTQQWLTLVLDLATAALAVLVVGVAVRLRATASIGLTGVSLVQLISFTETLKMLIQFWTSLETSIGAVPRIKNLSEETADEVEDDRLTRHDRALETDLKSGWPDRGAIEICDVSAALDGISISIRPGEKIGVVGRTGSGKSSLLLALLRLLPLSSGTISIDGRSIDSLPLLPLRSALIAITQDQFILPGTVRQNLDPLGTASAAGDAAVESALAPRPLGHNPRQRRARRRVRRGGAEPRAETAVLPREGHLEKARRTGGSPRRGDEQVIDAHTEKMVRDLVREEFNDHTVIAIAHRLGTVADFDRVVVLDKGRVVEVGNPQDLLLQGDGRFRELWDASRQHGRHDDA
ncbi:ABC transporter gloK [Colletotrichum shisoi]|uniref:ABC transporter gloK n=1 Tax=Colletotrichum shisoi TaxID=2078593 RepID=A0A5Q4BSJ4_9PEZI|nr:ABC transporter gloK [Colletotrichum shisoi]